MGQKYRPELDGLRAVAAILVLLFHTRTPGFSGGQQGVDVFFVLSGFLITTILNSGVGLRAFWIRRLLRLYPALLALVAALLLIGPITPALINEAVLALGYVRNVPLSLGGPSGILVHTWSLAIEMQFYLLWPLVLPLIRRWRPLPVLLTSWAALSVARILFLEAGGGDPPAYYSLAGHCSGIILGSALAFAPTLSARWAYVGGVAILAQLALNEAGATGMRYGTPLVEAGTAALILAASPLRGWLGWKPLARLGRVSYGVYLWHLPIAIAVGALPWWLAAPATLAASLTCAIISWVAVERPAMARSAPAVWATSSVRRADC